MLKLVGLAPVLRGIFAGAGMGLMSAVLGHFLLWPHDAFIYCVVATTSVTASCVTNFWHFRLDGIREGRAAR